MKGKFRDRPEEKLNKSLISFPTQGTIDFSLLFMVCKIFEGLGVASFCFFVGKHSSNGESGKTTHPECFAEVTQLWTSESSFIWSKKKKPQ